MIQSGSSSERPQQKICPAKSNSKKLTRASVSPLRFGVVAGEEFG
jgi:hypothetical protein